MQALLPICLIAMAASAEPQHIGGMTATSHTAVHKTATAGMDVYPTSADTRGVGDIQFNLSIASVQSREENGNPTNVIRTINTGMPGSRIVGIGWTTNQRAGGTTPPIQQPASWLSEMEMYFDENITQDGVGVFLRPSATQASGTENGLTSGGIVMLSTQGIPDVFLPDGIVRIEFEETFNDGPGVDGLYLGGSSIQVLIRPPGSVVCGDAVCDTGGGETCANCPQDCTSCCGNSVCDPGETCSSCSVDCGPCVVCGDFICNTEAGETCQSCAQDCGSCCGNGSCENSLGENCQTCSIDCGSCCGNFVCDLTLGENCMNCPQDCSFCCGNGFCDGGFGEDCTTCPQDCGPCGGSCGNAVCEPGLGETCSSCPSDCGPCGFSDRWHTCADPGATDQTYDDFSNQPIPADFFGPGSLPFDGRIQFTGRPLDAAASGDTDTIIQRSGDPVQPSDGPGANGSVPLQLVSLSLMSSAPVSVEYFDGHLELWDVEVGVSSLPQPFGVLSATKTHANGGFFDSTLPVLPKLTFVRRSDGTVRELDAGEAGMPPLTFHASNTPFVHSVNPNLGLATDPTAQFVPGVEEVAPGDISSQQTVSTSEDDLWAKHKVCPPRKRPPPDRWTTCPNGVDSTYKDVSLPAGFFGAGCNAFTGRIQLGGVPINPAATGTADTVVQRNGDPIALVDPPGTVRTTPINLVDLNLASTAPIQVICGGQVTTWSVSAGPSPNGIPPQGNLTATKTHANGGTFNSILRVWPRMVFTRLAAGCSSGDSDADGDVDRNDYVELAACLGGPGELGDASCACLDLDGDGDTDLRDFGLMQSFFTGDLGGGGLGQVVFDAPQMGQAPIVFQANGVPWVHTVNPALGLAVDSGTVFVPGVQETVPGSMSSQTTVAAPEQASLARHTVCPPRYEPQGDLLIEEIPPTALRAARNFQVTTTWRYQRGVDTITVRVNGNVIGTKDCDCDAVCTYVIASTALNESDVVTSQMAGCDGVGDDVSTRPIRGDDTQAWVDYIAVNETHKLRCGSPIIGPRWTVLAGAAHVDPDEKAGFIYPCKGITVSDSRKDVKIQYKAKDGDGDTGRSIWNLTVFELQTRAIKFDHKGGDADTADGLNIRKSFKDDLKHTGNGKGDGEWQKGSNNEEVLYVANKAVTLKARFTIAPKGIPSAKIKATAAAGKLQNVNETTINFDANGVSNPEYTEMALANMTTNGVAKKVDTYKWITTQVDTQAMNNFEFDQSGAHTVYVVLDAPKTPWYDKEEQHPWVDALEFTIVKAGSAGQSTIDGAVGKVTDFIHSGYGLEYDTTSGAAKYTLRGWKNNPEFPLTNFMAKTSKVVNCYDCAGALNVMANLLGASSEYVYMEPFGYINPTNLIGKGLSNNPFPKGTTPLNTGNNDDHSGLADPHKRRAFGNHALVQLAGKMWDACAGPHKGTETPAQYVTAAVDKSTLIEQGVAGDATNITGGRTVTVK